MAAHETRQAKNILFKQYIDPLLEEWGFVRHRRTYRLRSERDDHVIVDFQSATATTKQRYAFYVNLGVVPAPWLVWLSETLPANGQLEPDASIGLLKRRLRPPSTFDSQWLTNAATRLTQRGDIDPVAMAAAVERLSFDRWTIDTPESAQIVGGILTERLGPELEDLTSLLDRATFVARLRGQGEPVAGVHTKLAAEILLLVDDGMTAHLEQLLEHLELDEARLAAVEDPDDPNKVRPSLAKWARNRAGG